MIFLPSGVWAADSDVTIPDWVKSTAGWWAEGLVTDREFVDAIEYMVKNQIISSPTISVIEGTESSESQNRDVSVPDWIKNNAAWWAEGQIEDVDFASGIEYMVKNQIINSPNIIIIEDTDIETQNNSETVSESVTPEIIVPPESPLKAPPPEPTEDQSGKFKVLIIDNKLYPLVQFWSSESSKCNYESIWRTDTGKAIDVNGESINEGTDGCRFGLVAEIAEDFMSMTADQISSFEELTGIKLVPE